MNIIVYLLSIVGSLAVMAGVYFLIKKYAYVYLVIISIGTGIVAAKLIIARDFSILVSIGVVIICGLVAGIISIPALLMSDIDDLKDEIRNPEKKTESSEN